MRDLELHIHPDSHAVVYVGRMDMKKRLRELVEAAARCILKGLTCMSIW